MKKLTVLVLIGALSLMMIGCSTTEDTTVEDSVTEEDSVTAEDTAIAEDSSEVTPFGTFAATTTNGEEVTDSIFADYDITMVNIWATWCSPCVNEMDELQEVYAGLSDNVNMISICYDGGSETDLANEILDANSAEFIAIIPDADIITNIFSTLQYFPTTIFVDSEGNIVGERLEGAPSYNVVETYNAYIEEALASVGVE